MKPIVEALETRTMCDVAIVVAYNNPNIRADLASAGIRNLNLTIINLGTKATSQNWSAEAETDIAMVHQECPSTHIFLLETPNSLIALLKADQYAATLPHVNIVTNSWGIPEFNTEHTLDTYLTNPHVIYIAAAGDHNILNYPAASMISVTGYNWKNSPPGDVTMPVNSDQSTGTSVSAPLFAGLLEQNLHHSMSTAQLKAIIKLHHNAFQYHRIPQFLKYL